MEACAKVPESQGTCNRDKVHAKKVLEAIALSWESEAKDDGDPRMLEMPGQLDICQEKLQT